MDREAVMAQLSDNFQHLVQEGPFAFKLSRDQPIGQHFSRFTELSPEQTIELLAVRDGSKESCLIALPGETILAEHAGTGYVNETTGRSWGYTIRRRPTPGYVPPAVVTQPIPPQQVRGETFISQNGTEAAEQHSVELKHESELQEARLDGLKNKVRSEQLEADLNSLHEKLMVLEASLATSETSRSKLLVEFEAVKLEKAEADAVIPALRAELGAAMNTAAGTVVPPPVPESIPPAVDEKKQDLESKKWIAIQKQKIEMDRKLNAEVHQKVVLERQMIEAERADLKSRQDQFEMAVEEQKAVWVAPGTYASANSSGDEAMQILIRVFICWFITLVLIVHCVSLVQQAIGQASSTVSTQAGN